MKENGNERLKQSEFETNTAILDKLIEAELKKFEQKIRTYSSARIRYSGVEERAEEFILHYAKAKGYKIEDTGHGGIYSLKIFKPLSDTQELQIKFWADKERQQGYINTQFYLTEVEKTKE